MLLRPDEEDYRGGSASWKSSGASSWLTTILIGVQNKQLDDDELIEID